MGGEILKKFGRYFLLDQMAQGGMAEIYRARLASADGAGRLLVIKRVQAGYGDNREFLQMFKSEIKVTMGLTHPNIVQLFDFGEETGQPFIAMEFVDGKNLRQFQSRISELKQSTPIALVVHAIEQAATGLHYAHHFKDKLTGQPLRIVHRDISPQNIIISYEGTVKIIDFGIAKATTNVEATRVNVIKGKPSYLSPEQVSGEELDGRSDVFCLGIVLWELLAGKKLFAGDNDRAILMLIESSQSHIKPPSTVNPAVPKELDEIVLKSLAKDREKRFQSAEEFQRALHKFIYSYMPDFNPSDLGYYIKDLFKNDIVEDRKQIKRLNSEAERLLNSKGVELVSSQQGREINLDPSLRELREDPTIRQSKSVDLELSNSDKQAIRKSDEFKMSRALNAKGGTEPTDSGLTKEKGLFELERQQSRGSKKRFSGGGWAFLWASVLLVIAVFYAPQFGIDLPTAQKSVQKFMAAGLTRFKGIQGELDRKPGNVNPGETEKTVENQIKDFPVRLNIIPPGSKMTIALNGQPLNVDDPVLTVPLNTPLELIIKRDGYRDLNREFFVEAGQIKGMTEYVMEVQLDPLQSGYLSIHTTPSADAIILVDGKKWVKRTPFEREKVPVGTYTIRLVNELLGMEKSSTATIGEGKVVSIDERLEIK